MVGNSKHLGCLCPAVDMPSLVPLNCHLKLCKVGFYVEVVMQITEVVKSYYGKKLWF